MGINNQVFVWGTAAKKKVRGLFPDAIECGNFRVLLEGGV